MKIDIPKVGEAMGGIILSRAAWYDLVYAIEYLNRRIDGGIEVYSFDGHDLGCKDLQLWSTEKDENKKALLINVCSVPKETAEDVLRDFIKSRDEFNLSAVPGLWDRAKAIVNKTPQ